MALNPESPHYEWLAGLVRKRVRYEGRDRGLLTFHASIEKHVR